MVIDGVDPYSSLRCRELSAEQVRHDRANFIGTRKLICSGEHVHLVVSRFPVHVGWMLASEPFHVTRERRAVLRRADALKIRRSGDMPGCDATLHQQLGGWKRHIGRVSILVLPDYRGRGLARAMIAEMIDLARQAGLEKLEAEFIGEQDAAAKTFALLGFSKLLSLDDYVKDMQAVTHDYILMGLDLKTDEEYAGMG